jgi:hypothetical protein
VRLLLLGNELSGRAGSTIEQLLVHDPSSGLRSPEVAPLAQNSHGASRLSPPLSMDGGSQGTAAALHGYRSEEVADGTPAGASSSFIPRATVGALGLLLP